MYDSKRTASVLARLAITSAFTYLINAAVFGASGAALGALIASVAGLQSSSANPAAAGALLGAMLGAGVGLAVAYLAVVWIDWAAQMLSAIDCLAKAGGRVVQDALQTDERGIASDTPTLEESASFSETDPLDPSHGPIVIRHKETGTVLLTEPGARLGALDLAGMDLRGGDFSGQDLSRAQLCRAALGGAVLARSNLQRANLGNANLEGADLQQVDLRGAALELANLRRADLRGADLSTAFLGRWPFHTLLQDAVYDSSTKWPNGFDPQKRGAKIRNQT